MRLDRLLAFLTTILLFISVSPVNAQPQTVSPAVFSPLRILVLNSYHPGYTWSDREMDGVTNSLSKSGISHELHVEYLDAKFFPKLEHFERLHSLFAEKYRKNRPDLIITLDNPAFEFAILYRKKLFNNIPVIFGGLNDFTPAMLAGETGVTGVVERQDFIGTVKLARLLQPQLKEVVILHDFTSSGLVSRQEAGEQLAPLSSSIKFRYLPEMTIDEVVSSLKGLKPGTIVLPFSFSRDKSGRVFTHSELSEILGKNSPVPVYATKEERLGFGVIGGNLMEGKTHGSQVAGLAVRILNGELPDSIPIVLKPASKPMLDYQVMEKFGIKPSSLPVGTETVNTPQSFYSQHSLVTNIAAAIILLLAGSLAMVTLANRRRIKAEEALIESERGKTRSLEAANIEMESFCYAVSHDLQAPLRHIHSFSTILEEDYASSLDEQGLHCLQRLKSASIRMGDLISDLLTLSQISKAEVARTEFSLSDLAMEVIDDFLIHESSRSITLTVDKPMILIADRKLVRVILDNLIGNAWKYTSKTADAIIHLGAQNMDGRTVYFIRDNGAGFDMQYAEKLFAPFQRLHSDNEFEGNGIGLATVQRVIIRHGGQIWGESALGKGATFFFTLQP